MRYLVLLALLAGCGGKASLGAVCTRSSDCAAGLYCSNGRCGNGCAGNECSTTGGGGGGAPEFDVAFTASTLAVDRGTSASAVLSISRIANANGAIFFTLSGAGNGITATVVNSSTDNSVSVEVTAAASAALGNTALTLTATAASTTHTATLTVNVTKKIQLSVVDLGLSPVANVKARVADAWVTTGADGKAEHSVTTESYDLVVLTPGSLWATDGRVLSIFKGLSTATPTAIAYSGSLTAGYTFHHVDGSYSGTVSAPNHHAIFFDSTQKLSAYTSTSADSTTYSAYVSSQEPVGTPVSGTLFGGRWSSTQFYFGSAVHSYTTPADGATLAGPALALTAATTFVSSGTFSVPVGFNGATVDVTLHRPSGKTMSLYNQAFSGAGPHTFTTLAAPILVDHSISLEFEAEHASGAKVRSSRQRPAANASGLTYTLPAPITLALPAAAATGLTAGASFSWSASSSLKTLDVSVPATTPTLKVFCFTVADSCVLEDFSAIDPAFAVPHNAAASWTVTFVTNATADAAATLSGGVGLFGLEVSGDHDEGESEDRTFTTAP